MLIECFLRQGMVYLPTEAKTQAGFYTDVEPVAVIAVEDRDALLRALQEAVARGNPVIPTPPRNALAKPLVPKCAGQKTWKAFMRGMKAWIVESDPKVPDTAYRIIGQQETPEGGLTDDSSQVIAFPAGTEIGVVIDRLIDILQQAAQEESRKPN